MNLTYYITPTLVFPIVVLAAMFCLVSYYRHAMSPRAGTLEWVTMASAAPRPLMQRKIEGEQRPHADEHGRNDGCDFYYKLFAIK